MVKGRTSRRGKVSMGSEYTLNPNGWVSFRRLMEEPASSHHFCQRTVGEDSLPGYYPVTLMNSPMRTRLWGGVWAGGEKPPGKQGRSLICWHVKGYFCHKRYMPRRSRIDAPVALHHIIVRGIDRKTIFMDDADRDNFLERLKNISSYSKPIRTPRWKNCDLCG